jgi:hypothetical protein
MFFFLPLFLLYPLCFCYSSFSCLSFILFFLCSFPFCFHLRIRLFFFISIFFLPFFVFYPLCFCYPSFSPIFIFLLSFCFLFVHCHFPPIFIYFYFLSFFLYIFLPFIISFASVCQFVSLPVSVLLLSTLRPIIVLL